uniref:Lin1244/Lin1753-like N-terminal domain-containing protein n=1 Tax=viral metagenome TaxID=1070528 RepID=A0A6M3KIS1_9ZZZZ
MEWFKHSTGSHEDPDISDAWDQFGDAGPVVFWTILEVFGVEYSHLKDGWLTISIQYFERKLRRKFKKSEKILQFFEKRERIYFKIDHELISITIPKFIKIASNWTTRPKDKPSSLPTEAPTEAPHAKEEEEKKNKEKKKNNPVFVVPDFIKKETWEEYISLRRLKKAPNTPYALGLILKRIVELRDKHGQTPMETVNKSIERGWVGVFEIASGGNNGNGKQSGSGSSGSKPTAPGAAGRAQSDGRPYPVDAEY